MKRAAIILVASASIAIVSCCGVIASDADSNGSPRLAALVKELQAGNTHAASTFWKEVQGRAPLVESISADTTHRRVTFLWRGTNDTRRVSRSEEHTSELQSPCNLVCRLLLEKTKHKCCHV